MSGESRSSKEYASVSAESLENKTLKDSSASSIKSLDKSNNNISKDIKPRHSAIYEKKNTEFIESELVKELKNQIDELKLEISKLQAAQSNLEKSLNERPIVYANYPDKSGWFLLKIMKMMN